MSTIFDYSTILDNRTKVIFPVTAPTVDEEYARYTNKVDYNQLTYTATGVTGLGMGQVIVDGGIPPSDAPIQGFTKSFNQVIFTERARLSQQATYFMFNSKDGAKIDGELKSKILSLKNALTHAKNFYAQSMLAQGASTSFTFAAINTVAVVAGTVVDTTTADGVAYWSASHLREDGGTNWSNVVSGNPAFSFANIMAARTQHAAKKDGRGLPLIGSQLDRLVVQFNSAAHFLANSIKATLESGKYPSASPGASGSFVDANPTGSFDIVALAPYGSTAPLTGTSSTNWFMFDSKQVTKDTGFQYVQAMAMSISDWKIDYVGNMDYVTTATEYCQFGAADLRYWMASLN